ncbi:MAG: SPFH domain-containing protein [Bacteroidales bacterium]|nr:SPFH domain-containing protein [Candidatus Liminaster caballi]
MAIIDVVKCDIVDGEFCHKFPSDDLRIGSQLVVYPSQTAFFVKGGVVCDEFTAGTYTIKTENIPVLNNLVNIPFGGDSPFKAEVWFINQISKLDIPWGTPHPIQLEDPKYKIIVPVRAHGQYGLRISNPRIFLETLIGNMSSFTAEKIDQYFKGKMIASLNTMLAQQIINEGVSVLDINTQLMTMAETLNVQLNNMFEKYGISIVDFAIMSINVPENDDSVIRLKKAKDLAARLTITGRDVYQMERSFDVLQTAAGNEGAGGQMLAMGAGFGAGIGVGNAMGDIAKQTMNTNPTPPPIPQQPTYYAYINGSQMPNLTIQQIATLVQNGLANGETLVWTAGMANWVKLSTIPEFAHLAGAPIPPPINM